MSDDGWDTGGCLLAVGGVLIVFGALNAALALTVDTCTGGSADSLRGFVITLPLYLLGFGLAAADPRPSHIAVPLLMSPLALWHTAFSIRFGVGHALFGIAECDAFHGRFSEALQEESGSELMLIAGWTAVSVLFWGGVLLMWVRGRRSRRV